jgi:segregation and condensation protein A
MYRVQLQQFEGPLDLLLFFVRRDELDIHDIPIARITDEYLAYVRVMEEVDLDGVADFIYMAAILIGIKAKMLLPRPELDEAGEPIDPRAELVQRLLEYIRFKEVADHLEERHQDRQRRFVRGAASAPERATPEPTFRATVFDLIAALQRVLAEAPEEVVLHPVRPYSYTVEEQQAFLLAAVAEGAKPSFVSLMELRPRAFVVATFLAVLEMVQRRVLRVVEGASADDFRLALHDPPPVHPSLSDAVAQAEPPPAGEPVPRRPAADRAPRRTPTRSADG